MHVLMPDARSWGATVAARCLDRAGHTVHTCGIDAGGRCAAFRGERCPLDAAPIDAVVLVRASVSPTRLPGEEGVVCGVARRIPLIVAGSAMESPYADVATAEDQTDDVVTTLETVHSLPLPDHTVAASVALHESRRARGHAESPAYARVYRDAGRLVARLHFERGTPTRSDVMAAAVRVVGALREMDPWAAGIDVSVAGSAPAH